MKFFIGLFFLCCSTSNFAFEREEIRKGVVKIKFSNTIAFESNPYGSFLGSGFIVDQKNRLIATNNHVVPKDPGDIRIIFHNEIETRGTLIYTDIYHDFSIIQYEEIESNKDLKALKLGDFFSVKNYDKLLLSGNSEGQGITFKEGNVVELRMTRGIRHTLNMRTNLYGVRGTSGGPILNEKNEVVAVHARGSSSDSQSYDFAINYVKDALEKIIKKEKVPRYDMGYVLSYIFVNKIKKYLHGEKLINAYREKLKTLKGGLLKVNGVIAKSQAQKLKFEINDILVSINNQWIGDNLYLADKIVNENQELTFKIFRKGEFKTLSLKKENKNLGINEYITFAGGTFHEITPFSRYYWGNYSGEGIYMSQAQQGAITAKWGANRKNAPNNTEVIVIKINDRPVKNLKSFKEVIKSLNEKSRITVRVKDLLWNDSERELFVSFSSLQNYVNAHFVFNHENHRWVKKEDLSL